MRVVFMGSPEFAVPALRALLDGHDVALVVTQPDKPAGRGKRLVSPPIKRVAEAAQLPIVQPRSVRDDQFVATLRDVAPDVCVVVAYGKILPAAVLRVAPHGCVNIHGSLLPRYRGAAPIQWAIIRGEAITGVTIMRLDEGMDTGPMLLARSAPIEPHDTAGMLHDKLAPLGAELLLEALAGIAAGSLKERPQDDGAATYAPMLTKADGVVSWSQPARTVSARIRGVDPWPAAVTTLAGAPLKLFGATACAGHGAPGEVLAVDERGLVVACDDGACAIAEVQAAGKRRQPVATFVAGRPIVAGTILGA